MLLFVRVDMIGCIYGICVYVWDGDILIGRSKEIGVKFLKSVPAGFESVDINCNCITGASLVDW